MQAKVVAIFERLLAVLMRTEDTDVLSVTQDQVTPGVAAVDALVAAQAAVVNLGAVFVVTHLQELHHTAHACNPKLLSEHFQPRKTFNHNP